MYNTIAMSSALSDRVQGGERTVQQKLHAEAMGGWA